MMPSPRAGAEAQLPSLREARPGKQGRVRRLFPLAIVAGLAAFAGPASADVRFEGRTSQGRYVLLVAEDDGIPKRGAIHWQARCRRAGSRPTESTGFRRPLDVNGRRRFRDAGSYRERYRNGERVTFTVRIIGRKVGPRRWTGRFRVGAVVRRGGRVVDRCSARGVRWSARR
jgi:hypothetical protein